WEIYRDGVLTMSRNSPNVSFAPDDDGTYEFRLSVSDKDGGMGTAMSTTTIVNVAPTFMVLIASDLTALGETTVTVLFTDPGAADPFAVTIDGRDGSVESFPASGRYSTTGPLQFQHLFVRNPDPTNPAAPIPVLVTVSDDD